MIIKKNICLAFALLNRSGVTPIDDGMGGEIL